MKSKFFFIVLLLITTTCLFSFVNVNKEKSKLKEAKCLTCTPVFQLKKTSRSGNYVIIVWTGPANAYFTYVGIPEFPGTHFPVQLTARRLL